MVWSPRNVQLNKLTPNQATVGAKLDKVQADGSGFTQGVQIMLIRSGSQYPLTPADFLPGASFEITFGQSQLTFSMNLQDVTPGVYDALIWSPPLLPGEASDRNVLENAFTVKAA